jgi:hypothetical protein
MSSTSARRWSIHGLIMAGFVGTWACSGGGGSGGAAIPADPAPASTVLTAGEASPGVETAVLGIEGGTGPGGNFRVGDTIHLNFSLTKSDGSAWGLAEMTFSSAMVSGPTSNYQRVLSERTDVVDRATKNPDGSYTYSFDAPIPATYLPPYNDTPAVGLVDGELTGQPLLEGTYTVGLAFAWAHTVDGAATEDVAETTFDLLLGSAGLVMEPRAEVSQGACNACHHSLRAHNGRRREVSNCLLCHTAGAEDLNDPSIAGGTPGVLIDGDVLFHKIHMGRHLPSVVGIGIKTNGKITYNNPSIPYQVVGGDGTVHDYSAAGFPVFPDRNTPGYADFGYSALSPSEKAQEDMMRTGVRSCSACHGAGSGGGHNHGATGPAPATAGTAHFDNPSRLACGSCHDDWQFDKPYKTNFTTMAPQPDNSECTDCHFGSGGPLATEDGHFHPLTNPDNNPGLNVVLYQASESGFANFDGTVDVGEGISVTFEITDDEGTHLDPATLDEIRVIVTGPTTNQHVLLDASIPAASFAFGPLYQMDVPEALQFEYVGDSTAGTDVLGTSRFPHHDTPGGETAVLVRNAAPGNSSLLSKSTQPYQNYVDVQSPSGFARDEYIVIDDGTSGEEYQKIQYIEGQRLWFSTQSTTACSPGLRYAHAAGTTVQGVVLDTKTAGVDYSLNKWTGAITELVEFGSGNAVLVSYTTNFVLPATYPGTLNDSPDIGEGMGEWMGKPIADGTYTVTVHANRTLTLLFLGSPNVYKAASIPGTADFLVGSAGTIEPWALMQTMESCNGCHQEIIYHEGRYRSFQTCIACHGAPGAEDRPKYVSANAPSTPGRSVAFRELLHALHSGGMLPASPMYQVVTEGPGAYPDDFTVKSYESIEFPATRSTANCGMCHEDHASGHGNHGNTGGVPPVWYDPSPRAHPTAQGKPIQVWRSSCFGCHQDAPAVAHMDANTALSGVESCAICHDSDGIAPVDVMHEVR